MPKANDNPPKAKNIRQPKPRITPKQSHPTDHMTLNKHLRKRKKELEGEQPRNIRIKINTTIPEGFIADETKGKLKANTPTTPTHKRQDIDTHVKRPVPFEKGTSTHPGLSAHHTLVQHIDPTPNTVDQTKLDNQPKQYAHTKHDTNHTKPPQATMRDSSKQ